MGNMTLPTSDKPEDWEKAANAKQKEHDDYTSERWFGIGPKKERNSPQEKMRVKSLLDKTTLLRQRAAELRKQQSKRMSK